MDQLKFRMALSRKQRNPRCQYNSTCDLSRPELVGLIPSETEYELCCPNLKRKENITIVSSNSSSKTAILLQLKWRPHQNSDLVTLVSKLTLVVGGSSYYHDQIETYRPTESKIRPGRIMQYGSNGSNIKLIVASPCRRVRVVFRGHMTKAGETPERKIFVKLNFILEPTAHPFDFLDQFQPDHMKELYQKKKLSQKGAALLDLYFQDRYEQIIRLNGDCMIADGSCANERTSITAWGFYGRQFLEDGSQLIDTKRIMVHLNNGQAFHIGLNTDAEQNAVDFGYVCFEIMSRTEPIDKSPLIDWATIDSETKDFSLDIFGQGRSFKCKATRRAALPALYDVDMNEGKPGWALVLINDAVDSETDLFAIEQSRAEYQKAYDEGDIALDLVFANADKPLVVRITDEWCACTNLVGSKAASLAQLHSATSRPGSDANYVVPRAFVLTRFVYDSIIEQNTALKAEIDKLEQFIGEGDLADLRQDCERLRKFAESVSLGSAVRNELASCLEADYKNLEEVSFAVRSSSWGEDEEDMSAAGQLKTVLGVNGLDAILKAVAVCFASKFSYENIEYKRQHGLPLSLPMAVVIQEMVYCEKAGVMFTCDPTTGDDQLITITANYGLGESVVGGLSDPDSVRVRATHGAELEIEAISVGGKKVVIDADTLGGAEASQTDYDRTKSCLSDAEIHKLAKCGKTVAARFRCARDIEWGFKGDQLYLFQSRPVTGLDTYTDLELLHENDRPCRAEDSYCTRANLNEVIPFAIKPLTLSYIMFYWNIVGHRLYSRFTDNYGDCTLTGEEMHYDSYHCFFTLRCSNFLQITRQESVMGKAMLIGFFGRDIGEQPAIIEASRGFKQSQSPFQGIKYELYVLSLRLRTLATISREQAAAKLARQEVRELQTKNVDSKMISLYQQLAKTMDKTNNAWENHILTMLLVAESNMNLNCLLAKYIDEPVKLFSAVTKILGTSPDVISAEIPRLIESLADRIRAKGKEEVERWVEMPTQKALEYLETEDKELASEYATFIEKFGHRCYNEFELCCKPWREDPSPIINMLKQACRADKFESSHDKIKTLDQAIESLDLKMSVKDRLMLRHVIGPRCQTLAAAREFTKNILVEFTDVCREATRMLARELRRNLRIPDEELIYYVLYEELEPLIREPQPWIVLQATRRRNFFNKMFKTTWYYDEIIVGSDFMPNHMKPSKEVEEALMKAEKLHGTPASSGRVQGKVCLVKNYDELHRVKAGDILLTHSTDIAFAPAFPLISGIITEVGGLISHGAVVAREYGLPSLLGIPDATRILQDGEEIILDADKGVIIRLGKCAS